MIGDTSVGQSITPSGPTRYDIALGRKPTAEPNTRYVVIGTTIDDPEILASLKKVFDSKVVATLRSAVVAMDTFGNVLNDAFPTMPFELSRFPMPDSHYDLVPDHSYKTQQSRLPKFAKVRRR